MRNIRLIIAYDGSDFAGWQIQPQLPTIQGALEQVIRTVTRAPCRLRVAGRTDAGVHAAGQLANFRTEADTPLVTLHRGINALLPTAIVVLSVEDVDFSFDARENLGKRYCYSIWNQRILVPAVSSWSYHIHSPLNIEAMARAGRNLVGTRDFSAFRAACCDAEVPIRTLFRCTVGRQGALVRIVVEGTAFLRNMMRILAGTLVEVGQGKRDPDSIIDLLKNKDRRLAGMTLPAQGLMLEKVFL